MKKTEKVRAQLPAEPKHQRPGERAARFLLAIGHWIRDVYSSPSTFTPRGEVLSHGGDLLPAGKELCFPHILLVEDNPHTVSEFVETIRKFYNFGSITIFVAYAYDAAVTFFDNEDIDLVIMDADLGDEDGGGGNLIRKFLSERPEILILANSSSRLSNRKLTGLGAVETLGKSREKLRNWLMLHDPAGAIGG